MRKPIWLAAMALALSACSTTPTDTVRVEQASGNVDLPHNPQRVVSFDFGSADSMVALGVGDRLVGAPGGRPAYLVNTTRGAMDVGGMKSPDLEAIKGLKPDLIIVTGRQGESIPALQAIAPTLNLGYDGGDYLADVRHNIETLGALFEREEQASRGLDALEARIAEVRQQIASSGKKTLVLTHNDGRLSPREDNVVYSLLKAPRTLPAPPARQVGEPRQRPTPMSVDELAASQPEILFIVDRSAAIGQPPLDTASLSSSALADTPAARSNRVFYLDPPLWYLSGGGLQSVSLQIEQIAAAYR